MESECPAQDLHDVEDGSDYIFFMVLLAIMVHVSVKVTLTIDSERYSVGFSCVVDRGQALVDIQDHVLCHRLAMERERLFSRNLKSRWLDFECLLEDYARHTER